MIAIDNEGKVWTWGSNDNYRCGIPTSGGYAKPTCISNIEGSNIANVKIKKVAQGYDGTSILLDTEGKVWTFGHAIRGLLGDGESSGSRWNPICLNELVSNPLFGVKIKDISLVCHQASAVDENGKLWVWGENTFYTGVFAPGISNTSSSYPLCVSNIEISGLKDANLKYAAGTANNQSAGAIDENGELWLWGAYGVPVGYKLSSGTTMPTKVVISNSSYFEIPKFTKIATSPYRSLAIDEQGRVWTWGSDATYMGIGGSVPSSAKFNTPVLVGGYNENGWYNTEMSRTKIVDIAINAYASFAIDEENNLWAWGSNGSNNYYLGLSNSNEVSDMYYYPICLSKLNKGWNSLYNKKFVKIATNEYGITAAIDPDGNVWGWGAVYNYGIGIASCLTNNIESKFVDITVFDQGIIALDENGKLYGFGANSNAVLAYAGGAFSPLENEGYNNLVGVKIKKVVAKHQHCLALDENGKVYAWGYNGSNVLGTATSASRVPGALCITEIYGNALYGKKIVDIEAGNQSSLAIDEDGNIYTWGYNGNYRLAQDNTDTVAEIRCINAGKEINVKQASFGENYLMVLDKDGEIWSAGYGSNCATGFGTDTHTLTKVRGVTNTINPKYGIVLEKISDMTTESVTGNLYLSGEEEHGEENEEESVVTKEEVLAKSIKASIPIGPSGSEFIYYVLTTDGELWSWGQNNTNGIVGDGTTNARYTPIKLNDLMDGAKIERPISPGYPKYEIFLDTDNYIWYWGDGIKLSPCKIDIKAKGASVSNDIIKIMGEDGYLYSYTMGIENPTLEKISDIVFKDMIGSYYAVDEEGYVYSISGEVTKIGEFKCNKILNNSGIFIIVDTDGYIWTWGNNNYGQCGTGNTNTVTEPHKIEEFKYGEDIYVGNTNIIKDDEGKIWTWGQNNYGQCGVGSTSNVTTPTCISDSAGFTYDKTILSGYTNAIMDTDGNLWLWGQNTSGKCGTGNTSNVTTPTKVNLGDGITVSEVLYKPTSSTQTFIVKDSQGKLWSWGYGYSGQCGTGCISINSPTCISDSSDLGDANITEVSYIRVANSGYIMLAIDSEGNTWVWGYNIYKYNNTTNIYITGTGSTDGYVTPKKVVFPEGKIVTLKNINAGSITSYGWSQSSGITAEDSEGKTWIWGLNTNGSLGVGKTEDVVITPVCIEDYYESIGLEPETKEGRYIIDKNGDIWTWGVNTYGQCGTGNTDTVYNVTCITQSNQVKFDRLLKYSVDYSGAYYCVAVDKEGKIWTWGQNNNGQCGTGTTENVLVPTCICAENTASASLRLEEGDQIQNYNNYWYILKPNGEAWAWGNGLNGNTPLKLNSIEEVGKHKIVEIAANTAIDVIDILLDNGRLYRVSAGETAEEITVQDVNSTEIVSTETGPWPYQFYLIKDAKYLE